MLCRNVFIVHSVYRYDLVKWQNTMWGNSVIFWNVFIFEWYSEFALWYKQRSLWYRQFASCYIHNLYSLIIFIIRQLWRSIIIKFCVIRLPPPQPQLESASSSSASTKVPTMKSPFTQDPSCSGKCLMHSSKMAYVSFICRVKCWYLKQTACN